jgi:hypothetical protein
MKSDKKALGYRGDRVRANTAPDVNRFIDHQTQQDIQTYQAAGPDAIEKRIFALEQEWDIERILEMNASAIALLGVGLGIGVNKRWFALPLVVLPFLFQHAIQGWCPPLPFLRRMGVRTQREIEAEKYALKSLQKMEIAHVVHRPAQLSVGL